MIFVVPLFLRVVAKVTAIGVIVVLTRLTQLSMVGWTRDDGRERILRWFTDGLRV